MTFDVPLKDHHRDPEVTRVALREWLRSRIAHTGALDVSALSRPASTGAANETLLFDVTSEGSHRGFVARLLTDDPLYLEASVEKQFRMYAALADAPGVPVPTVVAYEPDPEILGTPFFVMERVEGLVPATVPHFSREGWVVDATPAQRERLWHSAVEQLVALHRLDADRFEFLAHPERGASGLEQDLTYWETAQRWAGAAEGYPILDAGAAWLRARLPADAPTRLSWGDSRVENMLFRDFRCVAVLDFETASLAGPLGDLAWWVLMDRARGALAGFGSPRETVALYRDLGGATPIEFRYWGVLTAYRLAVIHVKLARQMAARGIETATTRDFGASSEKMQQLALLLELTPPGDLTASLPDVDW